MRYHIIILAFTLLLAGCTSKNELAEALLESQDISITWKGDVQVSYDPETFQLGYNSASHEYRVYDDRLADWFTLRCDEIPTQEGQSITADVTWTGERSPKVFNEEPFTVRKVSEDGRVWLWSSKNKIGIIIKHIQ